MQKGRGDRRSVLFVMNTMGRAGAERALVSLLGMLDPQRLDISLLVLVPLGEMIRFVPPYVRVLNDHVRDESVFTRKGRMRIAGQILKSLLKPRALGRFLKTFPRNFAWQWKRRGEESGFQLDKLCWELIADGVGERYTRGKHYDLAVAYVENASTYFVARYANADKKASFLHVDYAQSGHNPAQDAPFYAAYDAIFAVSEDVRLSLARAIPQTADKLLVFHNRIPAGEIRRMAAEGQGFDDGFSGLRLLTVARLHPQKALDIAILAFRRVLDENPDLRLRWYIMGEGPERDKLEKLIAAHGLENDFILMGARDNPYPYTAQCDIYLQATHYEGWSIAIAEALVLARPVIASDGTGNREQIVSGVNGVLVPLGVDALAEAIANLARDAAERERLIQTLQGTDFRHDAEMQWLYMLAEGKNLLEVRRGEP